MRKTRKPRRLLKKLSRPRGGDRRKRGSWQADRDLVSRRSSDRAEKQGHPPMGETRDTAFGAARPEDEFSLYFRRHLPGRRKRRRACPPLLQQRGHGPAEISLGRSHQARMRSFFSIRPGGMSRRSFPFRTTSRSCRCRRNRPSSIRSRTSGSSCATTGSRTASSRPDDDISTTAASPGTSSSTCPGKSSPSEQESGPIGCDQRDLVSSCHTGSNYELYLLPAGRLLFWR